MERIRPAGQSDVGSTVKMPQLLGWYARKGAVPALRGLWYRLWLGSAPFPLFIGRAVTIHYARRVRVGAGFYLGDSSRVLALSVEGVTIGNRVTIRENAWIQCASSLRNPGIALTIGDGTYIGPYSVIGVGGPIIIGERCQFGAGVTLIAENHEVTAHGVSAHDVIRKGITIGSGTWIGHRATVLDGVELGENCVVGAGAVVTRSFPAGTTLVGVPARPVTSSAGREGA
ncbi:acyltransferase [Microbacterium sp. M3]|uniref:Acyltransferase n=1 Tax=Microbacterium arthrosphaerae TaxID=792652 RepID=A0ABU4H3E8_9MICO|nr:MULTISPECIES: acyltransferase [Microbacterium]MDW4573867.1 acyltransferase [Microbacterium arthrosphaerae]MDW7607722.1 acyltransferase [Microbacterium sp. M3]